MSPIQLFKDKVLEAIAEVDARYPADIFPPDGASLDCAGARLARNILSQIREKVDAIEIEEKGEEVTPGELARRYGFSNSGIYRRLHHRNCPQTERHTSNGKLMTVRISSELDRFLKRRQGCGVALLG